MNIFFRSLFVATLIAVILSLMAERRSSRELTFSGPMTVIAGDEQVATSGNLMAVAQKGTQVRANAGSYVIALEGALVYANGGWVDAHKGSTVIASAGVVVAEAGSKVDAYVGSTVYARTGSTVTEAGHPRTGETHPGIKIITDDRSLTYQVHTSF